MTISPFKVIEVVSPMRGGSQPHLCRCTDGGLWVVKCANSPQGGGRLLVNEWVASTLAGALGLPVPAFAAVEVEAHAAAQMVWGQSGRSIYTPLPGLHFASSFISNSSDMLPDGDLAGIANLRDFWGALILDKWLCNVDGRQATFSGGLARFIDFGFCFNAESWTFQDAALRGVYRRPLVYRDVRGLSDFSRWIERLYRVPVESMHGVPPEWLQQEGHDDTPAFMDLMEALDARKEHIEPLLLSAVTARRFPNWVSA